MRNTIPWPSRPDNRPLCIAHRGASAHALENTLAAFRIAAELGADMWEIDVQLTADNQPVVSHDTELNRAFGKDGTIAELTLAQIRERAPDLPTLREVVALAQSLDQALYVEIKARGAGRIAATLLAEMEFEKAGLGSFGVEEVRDMIEAGLPYPISVLVPLGADPLDRAEQSGADIIHLCWERGGERPQDLVTPELLAEAARRGLAIVLWHEERKWIIDDLIVMPVLGICTNQPELMAGCDSVDAAGIQIVCHRGANYFAPENTIAAARLILDQGCDYLELDVRESADGEIVVIHDPTLERTTDGTGRVIDKTLAQLQQLDAGSWFSSFYKDQKIPTLRQMIALCQSYGRKMYIENKSVDPAKLVALVESMDFIEDCFFWSGNDHLQAGLRAASPKANIKATRERYQTIEELVSHLAPSLTEIHFAGYEALAEEVQRFGITPMMQYFGDDPAIFDKIVALSPPMINLNRSDLLLAALRRRH